MPLTRNDRDAIRAAIGASVEPVFVRDALTLQLVNKRIVLARPNGSKTLAGGLYEREKPCASCHVRWTVPLLQ